MNEEMKNLPMVALRSLTVLPGTLAHFNVSRERSIKAVEQAMLSDEQIFLVTQVDPDEENPPVEGLYRTGVVCVVKQVIKLQNNLIRVLVEGKTAARIGEVEYGSTYATAEVYCLTPEGMNDLTYDEEKVYLRSIKDAVSAYSTMKGELEGVLLHDIASMTDLYRAIYHVANNLPFDYDKRQELLEKATLRSAAMFLLTKMEEEMEMHAIRLQLDKKVKEQMEKNQRDYFLRSQIKVIREELGEDNTDEEVEGFEKSVEELLAPEEVKEKIRKEIRRFKNLSSGSSEAAVSRGYIETLLEMPWDKMSVDNEDLANAKRILDEDHYGLTKVKERMLEFLAVRTLTKKGDSPIICLVGPPGTGKTSIARSVARALEKKYIRLSLGGVRDEAEIRGHRRTYIGAMPGRIATELKNAGVKNPLMLLDEIDKVSSDYKGDVSSALLEVLDSEQNSRFSDHYLEIPIDLSEVLFICTANSTQTIPRPLLDRMEIIEVSSYTENEKRHIALEHLIDKQIAKNGLKKSQISIHKRALDKIIRNYTKEAGVRSLERKIGEICRKAARELLEENVPKVVITDKNLQDYLGKEKYSYHMANRKNEIGIVRGLAWTSVGGDTLQIEVNIMPGKGEISLTGQLGDVMKESAHAGLSYIRSVSERYGIAKEFFKENDIHIHIPEGAVPKDGPSAGITMATAMLSAITHVPVRADVAMTGEITLRGRVLPIGGLKEKTLAAKNAKIKTVLVPEKNRPDIEEIEEEILEGLEIVYVSSMEEVLAHALVQDKKK